MRYITESENQERYSVIPTEPREHTGPQHKAEQHSYYRRQHTLMCYPMTETTRN